MFLIKKKKFEFQISEGKYDVLISLSKPLDYERRNSYLINLVAVDGAIDPAKKLRARATVAVDVLDVQDQPPVFLNAPYSAALPENTPEGQTILTVRARDGDMGMPRPLLLSLEGEDAEHFTLQVSTDKDVTVGRLITTDNSLDREDPLILQNGGIYTFKVKATELIDNETPAESAYSIVTIVVTDVDDMEPSFNKDYFHIKISEDIGLDTPLPGTNHRT